jgi:hypothetical protein
MAQISRRTLLGASAGVAATAAVVGVNLSGVTTSATASAGRTGPTMAEPATGASAQASGPLVVFVRDASKPELSIMSGDSEWVVRDAELVSRLVRAARRGEL